MPERDYSGNADAQLSALRGKFHSGNTCSARATAVKEYERMCQTRNLTPWPATAANLELLAAFMLDEGQPATGLAYVSHCRTENKLRHGSDVEDSPYLKFVNQALSRGVALAAEDYEPWGLELIKKLYDARGMSAQDKIVVDHALVQFHNMMRPDELIDSDFGITGQNLLTKVKTSKADQEGLGRDIQLAPCPEWHCPVSAARRILAHGRIKTLASYRNQLKIVLAKAKVVNRKPGRKRDVYLPHGIRKGAAQAFLLSGTNRELVQKLGGWNSPASLMRYEAQVMLNPGKVSALRPQLLSIKMLEEAQA